MASTEDYIATVLRVAYGMVGDGEATGNNKGPDINLWLRETGLGKPDSAPLWCALWISYAFLVAARFAKRPSPFVPCLRAKGLVDRMANVGMEIVTPAPGAVICWHRGILRQNGHVELVKSWQPERLITIAGNVGEYPSKIHERTYGPEWKKRLYKIALVQ